MWAELKYICCLWVKSNMTWECYTFTHLKALIVNSWYYFCPFKLYSIFKLIFQMCKYFDILHDLFTAWPFGQYYKLPTVPAKISAAWKKKPAVFAIPKRLIVYRITYVHFIYVKFNLQVRMFLNNLLVNKV